MHKDQRRPVLWLILGAFFIQSSNAESLPAVSRVAEANNRFALELYREVAKKPGNVVLSPVSIYTALSMAYAGARGETAEQMAKVLHLPRRDASIHAEVGALLKELKEANLPGCNIAIANGLWAQQGYPFLKPFQRLLQEQYDTRLNVIDLTGWPHGFDPAKAAAARKRINNWAAEQTRDKIQDLIPPSLPDLNTRLMLVNAVWFKAVWATRFDPTLTRDSLFHLDSGAVSVPMMHVTSSFRLGENDELQVLEAAYASNRFSMVFCLPRQGYELSQLERSLTLQQIERLERTSRPERVIVSIPRFKMNSEFSLEEPLETLGMTNAFYEDLADFSGITPANRLFIEAAIHKACVRVDEKGTEAAGGTMISVADSFETAPPFFFKADHPFLFLIRDNVSGAILFIGRVVDPRSG